MTTTVEKHIALFISMVAPSPRNFKNFPGTIHCGSLDCPSCPLNNKDDCHDVRIDPPVEVINYIKTNYPEVLL
jgi:hypothetical protein